MGLGGIGNGLTLQLAAIGHKLIIQDVDTIEDVNLAPQGFMLSQLGKTKVEGVSELMKLYYDEAPYLAITDRFTSDSKIVYPITMSCVDNMKTRKDVFEKWVQLEDRELLLDGRMSTESFDLYVVTKDTEDKYRDTLYDDGAILDAPCTYKITKFMASIIQGFYTQTLCNYLSDLPLDFKFHYVGQLNTTEWT